ncbi:MAG: CorA family divalent cation transporter [Candidatus Paceibacterota bacterium]
MRRDYQYNGVTWIDLHQPTQEELRGLMHEKALPPDVVNDLASPSNRSTTELHGDRLYTVFHFPAFQHTHSKGGARQELDFVIMPGYLITVHYDTIDALHKFSKMVESRSILKNEEGPTSSAELFFALLKKLYKSVYHEIEYAEDWLDRTEDNIFSNREREMVSTLSEINRRFLDIKKTVHPHDEQLRLLKDVSLHTDQKDYARHADSLLREYTRIQETIDHDLALVRELQGTNNSLVNTKQNENMQTLTSIAYIALPVTIVASIFGMNASNMPVVGGAYDFWFILGIMAVITVLFFLAFKWKKLL